MEKTESVATSPMQRGVMQQMQVKILGKRIDGWIFKTPKLSVEILEAIGKTRYIDIPVNMATYYAAKDGAIWLFDFEQHDDGLWYVA